MTRDRLADPIPFGRASYKHVRELRYVGGVEERIVSGSFSA